MTAQTILPANSVTASFDVANALRFEPTATDNLVRDPSSSGNRRTFTISFWMKFSEVATTTRNIITSNTAGNDYFMIRMEDHQLQVLAYNNGTKALAFNTSALYRDPSSWHHVVVAVDTTQGTEGNRFKMYVNGTQITSFATDDYPSQNVEVQWNHTENHFIGCFTEGTHVYKGYLCEIVNIDGSQLDVSSFGEFDSDSPTIWKPKNPAGLTFGTNGFYLNIPGPSTGQNASGMGGDSSGNGHHFGSSGLAADSRVTDTCTNNFSTMNPIYASGSYTFTEGNLTVDAASADDISAISTIGFNQGKWYLEFKIVDQGSRGYLGFTDGADRGLAEGDIRSSPAKWGMYMPAYSSSSNTSGTINSNLGTATDNDIICFAFDADNGQLFMSKNGNVDISSTAAMTGITTGNIFHFFTNETASSDASGYSINFGNPAFSISSGNADADGHGNFEYAVPSGYFALNTKNLAEYG